MSLPGDLIDTAIDLMLREKFTPSQYPSTPPSSEPGDVEIKSLVSRLHCSDVEESKKATWSISNLSRRPLNRRGIITEQALPVVVEFLKDKSDSRVVDVLSLLTNLSQTAAYRREILQTDALPSVLSLLKLAKMPITEQGIEFVANMCLNRQAKERLVKEKHILEVLLSVIKKPNPIGKNHAVRALVQLSYVPSVSNALLRMTSVKYFVDCLMALDDWIVKAWLAELIYNLSLDVKNLRSFGSVCVWQMIELLDSKSERVCKVWALKALGNLTRRPQLRRNVMRQGGIPSIANLIKDDDTLYVEEAMRCMANLTRDSEKVKPCMRKGVIPVLVKLLEAKSPAALATVANVSEVEEQKLVLLESGVIPLLVQFLKLDHLSEIYQRDTLRCLAHLSDVDLSISWFLEPTVVSKIVYALRSACPLSCSYAAQIVSNIAESPQGIREIVESDAIWLLVRLTRSKSDSAVLSAVKALSVLSSNRHARALMTQFDGVTELLTLLKENSDAAKIHAAKTLYDLSSNMDVQHAVVCDGGIPTLIGMLSSHTFEVRENALCLLIRLGFSKLHWAAIKEGGGVGLMLKQLVVCELKDTFGICQSFVKFFNAVILVIIKGHFGAAE